MNFSINKKRGLLLALLVFVLWSCNKDTDLVTKSGLKVKVLKKGEGTPAIKNGIAQLNLIYKTEDGRELFNTVKRGAPIPVRMTEEDKGLLDEVVDVLNIGDSVSFSYPAEDLFEKTYGIQLPDSIERGTTLNFNMSLVSTLTKTAYEGVIEEARAKQVQQWRKEEADILKADIASIDNKLTNEGKDFVKLPSGVRFVINKKGKGRKAKTDEQVNIYYSGKYMENGEVFDERVKGQEPYSFPLGSGVIEGLTIGMRELSEGTSAAIYIPSGLAYGTSGYREIPANSVLVFEVDFIKIGK